MERELFLKGNYRVCEAFYNGNSFILRQEVDLVGKRRAAAALAAVAALASMAQAAPALTAGNPQRAIDNANAHEYVGENTPYQAMRQGCPGYCSTLDGAAWLKRTVSVCSALVASSCLTSPSASPA